MILYDPVCTIQIRGYYYYFPQFFLFGKESHFDNYSEDFGMNTSNFVLQEATPLRDSIIWDLQNQFYIRKGASCWTDSIVPHFVTSNSYIAYQYANCILGYIRDYYNS